MITLIVLCFIVFIYVLFNNGELMADELRHEIQMLDLSRNHLALFYPELFPEADLPQIHHRALIMAQDTFVLRYEENHAVALFFRYDCSLWEASYPAPINKEYLSLATNSLIGDGIFIEHSKDATNSHLCQMRMDGRDVLPHTVSARLIEFGHIEAPYLRLKLPNEKRVVVQLILSAPKNLVSLYWTD